MLPALLLAQLVKELQLHALNVQVLCLRIKDNVYPHALLLWSMGFALEFVQMEPFLMEPSAKNAMLPATLALR